MDPGRRLYLKCNNDVAAQVERMLGTVRGARVRGARNAEQEEWTHRYPISRPLSEAEHAFLDLLKELLTLHLGPSIRLAIALDFYKDPASHPDPMQWADTAAGALVHRAKYARSRAAFDDLARKLAEVADRHPDFRGVEIVISAPSHSPRRFSERLAAEVANLRKLPLVEMHDASSMEVKEGGERPPHQMSVDGRLVRGRSVLILDDVCRSGETLRAAAACLTAAGATGVYILVAARTLRN